MKSILDESVFYLCTMISVLQIQLWTLCPTSCLRGARGRTRVGTTIGQGDELRPSEFTFDEDGSDEEDNRVKHRVEMGGLCTLLVSTVKPT